VPGTREPCLQEGLTNRQGAEEDLHRQRVHQMVAEAAGEHAPRELCAEAIQIPEQRGGTGSSVCETPVNPGLGFGAFSPAQQTIQGREARPMLRKGQLEGVAKGDVLARNRVINQLFGLAASRALTSFSRHSHEFLQHNHVESHTSSAV
jgi:hypothetical protein